jgi:hypothetical protein
MNDNNKPFVDSVYSLETLISSFIPSAVIMYDLHGQVIIHTDLMTDEDGNLIPFAFDPKDDNVDRK